MADNRRLLNDLRLKLEIAQLRPVYTVDMDQHVVVINKQSQLLNDLGSVSGIPNLAQAVIMRLLTPRGELSELAHPDYGSRLHELIGQQNTENTRNLIKLYILESLQLEPRIAQVVDVSVTPDPVINDRVNVLLKVQPIGETQTVVIGPFTLELGQ